MNKPDVDPGTDLINFSWPELKIKIVAEGYETDGHAELSFFSGNGTEQKLLDQNTINLLSPRTKDAQARKLERLRPDIPWDDALTWITHLTMELARQSEPPRPVGKKPETMKIEYQVFPILERNQPTTIYSPGGYAKSYLAAYIACLVQFNRKGIAYLGNDWAPTPGNVLYLDWESSFRDHARRVWAVKQGLGITTEETFEYLFCHQPLIADVRNIERLVIGKKISLVIIDSQMAASGYGPDASQISSQFYNALRSLQCTTLSLDHVSKAEWGKMLDADSLGPYGSVVKFNRSRSQFEIWKSQKPGDDFIELSLKHRKHNEGTLLKDIGIRIEFHNKPEGELEKVTFKACNIADNPELSKTQSLKDRLSNALAGGSMSTKALADELDKPEGTIRASLNRHKDSFVNLGNEWGLKAYES